MEWQSEAVIVEVRSHGEQAVLLTLFTPERGRWMGYVRGGKSKTSRSVLQVGNLVSASWYARVENQLGNFRCELISSPLGFFLNSPLKLAALSSLLSLVLFLPEREAHPRLYKALELVKENLENDALWPSLLVHFEVGFLQELGFRLSLNTCAVTGEEKGLRFVSPKTGRVVSEAVGWSWRERLLPLPAFFQKEKEQITPSFLEIRDALLLTGYFLGRHIFEPRGKKPPFARERLLALLSHL